MNQTVTDSPAPRPRTKPWRVAIVVGIVSVMVLLLVAVGSFARTGDVTGQVTGKRENAPAPGAGPAAGRVRPIDVEAVAPGPADVVGPQPEITADMSANFNSALIIDGKEIPDDQVTKIVPLGQISFRPGKGKDIEFFEAGLHNVEVVYWPDVSTRAVDGRTFTWTFRVAA